MGVSSSRLDELFAVYWTHTAQRDVENIITYIHHESPRKAREIFALIQTQAQELQTLPRRGRIVPELLDVGVLSYRELIIERWRLAYRVQGTDVYVMMFIDARQNSEDILFSRLIKNNDSFDMSTFYESRSGFVTPSSLQSDRPANSSKPVAVVEKVENRTVLEVALSSVFELKNLIFLPYARNQLQETEIHKNCIANNGSYTFISKNMSIEIRGNLLMQMHLDVFEALLNLPKQEQGEGYVVEFTLYALQKKMGKEVGNYPWVREILKEIHATSIHIKVDNQKFSLSLLKILDDEDGKYSVKFDSSLLQIYQNFEIVNYSEYFPKIANLSQGWLKSIVRFMLQHKQHRLPLSDVYKALHFYDFFVPATLANYTSAMRRARAETLSEFGITIDSSKRGNPYIEINRTKNVQ